MSDLPASWFAARRVRLDVEAGPLDAEWLDLLGRAIEGQPFLAPWFLRPALRWLDPGREVDLLLVERFQGERRVRLDGLLPVHAVAATRSLPRAHLSTYRPLHAYQSGALVDAERPVEVLRCLRAALPELFPEAGALRLSNLRIDGPLGDIAGAGGAGLHVDWFPTRRASRAALRPEDAATAESSLPGNLGRQLRRARARLEDAFGALEFRVLQGESVDATVIERHLELEHAGWKGDTGVALLSSPAQADFFRELSRGAARAGGAVFCELRAGPRVVASTSNFIAGHDAVAFKMGWDPGLASASPGLLVDDELRRHLPGRAPALRFLDGCADPGSHLDRLWPGRTVVEDGYVAWRNPERWLLGAYAGLRKLRRRLRSQAR